MQHVDTAKGQCEAVICPRKEVKGKRIGVKRNIDHTAAAQHPDWLFDGEEFAWVDSAYSVTHRTIPVYNKPASLYPENAAFDKAVSHLHVRSEHCMGALKG